jgi:hypothetical protein
MDDALPFAITSTRTKLGAKLNGAAGVSASATADYQQKVESLLVGLDKKNNALMENFRAIYLVFKSDPCTNALYFAEETKRLSCEHGRLAAFEVRIDGLIELARSKPSELVIASFRDLAAELASSSPELSREVAVIEIVEARSETARWIANAADGGQGEINGPA